MPKSIFTTNESPVYISDNMSGKMKGIAAISTSVLMNKLCQIRAQVVGSICEKCFAMNTVKRYHALEKHLEENTKVLTERVLDPDELPRFLFTVVMVRFEAFGDLNNVIQAINYLNIAYANPRQRFALWTKNPHILKIAIEEVGKPENIMLIYSSPLVNCERDIFKMYPFFDKVFTVFSKDYIKEHGIEINCGARSCAGCGLCYFDRSIQFVREVLK